VVIDDPNRVARYERAEALRRKIEEVKKRFPAHSISPVLMHQLDELDEAFQTETSLSDPTQPSDPPQLLDRDHNPQQNGQES